MDVGQTEVTTAITEGEFFMIQAHQMQNRGVQVMDVNFVFDSSKTEFVGDIVSR